MRRLPQMARSTQKRQSAAIRYCVPSINRPYNYTYGMHAIRTLTQDLYYNKYMAFICRKNKFYREKIYRRRIIRNN